MKSFWYRRGLVLTAVSIAALVTSGAVSPSAGSAVSTQAVTPFAYTGGTQSYTVPTDGSVCSLTIDAAGENGGSATNVAPGATGVGGTGGHVTATFTVSPGDDRDRRRGYFGVWRGRVAARHGRERRLRRRFTGW